MSAAERQHSRAIREEKPFATIASPQKDRCNNMSDADHNNSDKGDNGLSQHSFSSNPFRTSSCSFSPSIAAKEEEMRQSPSSVLFPPHPPTSSSTAAEGGWQ